MRLTLSRNPGESILIGDAVSVTVVRSRRGRTLLRIDAPGDCRIQRAETDAEPIPGRPGTEAGVKTARRAGKVRPAAIRMPKLPPLAARVDPLARWVKRRRQRRGDDFGSCGITV